MLTRSRRGEAWTSTVAGEGAASLGWVGWQRPQVADANGLRVVIDGRIYNRRDFQSGRGDAEIVADLYAQGGFEHAVARLNGDFAIALYDARADVLWLARDRFGVKPLYYVDAPDRFAFASQPGPLLTLPGVTRRVNRRFTAVFAGAHYRYFDNCPDESPYEGISQLPAGHILRVGQGGTIKTRYWALHEAPDFATAAPELGEQYRALLMDAVGIRLATAEKPAFTLSGGMDSSSVVASAMRMTGHSADAFSTVYKDKTYDESGDIRPMVEATGLRWHPVPVGSPDVFATVERMVRIHDEPVATATWLSHFLLCEEVAGRGFATLFGGLGGDELNAGEYEYFLYHFADLKVSGRDDQLRTEVASWVEHHDHPVFRKSQAVVEEGLAAMVDLSVPGRCLPDRRRLRRYFSTVQRDFFDLEQFEPRMDHVFSSYLKNRTAQDLFTETLPCCLRAEDRHGSASGIEHVAPFLDHRLAEFMYRVPGTSKIRNGVTKQLLREAMTGVLPDETRTRIKKTGWNAPAHVWFSGPGLASVRDLVCSATFRQRGLYDVAEVERLIDEHADIVSSGRPAENHMMFFWQMVNVELWLRSNDAAGADAGHRDS